MEMFFCFLFMGYYCSFAVSIICLQIISIERTLHLNGENLWTYLGYWLCQIYGSTKKNGLSILFRILWCSCLSILFCNYPVCQYDFSFWIVWVNLSWDLKKMSQSTLLDIASYGLSENVTYPHWLIKLLKMNSILDNAHKMRVFYIF